MQEVYEPMKDSTISRFLATRKKTRPVSIPSRKLYWHKILQILKDQNLSYPEFIPTHFFQFMQTVGTYFPRHRLILSDYHTVPGAIEGINAPLVQAGYKGMLVPCATYQMAPGWFDVLFPTNFEQTRQLYLQVCRSNEKNVKILRYSDFLERYGDIEKDKRIDNLTLKIHDKINILLS